MFNQYAVRPIGSETFLEHLKDVQTRKYYEDPEEDVKITTDCHGHVLWQEKEQDPYESLLLAIVALSIHEYLYYYMKRNKEDRLHGQSKMYWVYNSRCIQLENDYFRKNPFLNDLFDKLLRHVCWEGNQEIEQCSYRTMHLLRWTKKNK